MPVFAKYQTPRLTSWRIIQLLGLRILRGGATETQLQTCLLDGSTCAA